MNRREALAAIGTAVATGVTTTGNDYVPAGHVNMKSPVVRNVERVFLNGREVDRVYEFNDVEGWLRRYVTVEGGTRSEHLTGAVRVEWKR